MNRRYGLPVLIIAAAAVFVFLANDRAGNKSRMPVPQLDAAREKFPIAEQERATATVAAPVGVPRDEECLSRDRPGRIKTEEGLKAAYRAAAMSLAESQDEEHRLASAILERWSDPENAIRHLQELGGFSSENPVVVWTILALCGQRAVAGCDTSGFGMAEARKHSNNGAFWLVLAIDHIEAGRTENAIDALRSAAAAPTFNTYFSEQIGVIDRGLAAATDWSLAERQYGAVVYSSVAPRGFRPLTEQCEKDESGVWLELCEQIGIQMSENATDMLNRHVGLDIRKLVHERRGDEAGVLELQNEIEEGRSLLDSAGEAMNLLSNDEVALQDHLDNLESYGEVEAWRRLEKEVTRLQSDPDYDQCNFAVSPFSAS